LYKQKLLELLKKNFPKHQILLLSDVLLPHFADFVGWYDKADAIVTIETAHRHLAMATKQPVFALAADKPTKWNGTAWSQRLAFYCRYSEFEQRLDELIQAIKDKLSGVKQPEVTCLN
jgi:ADP-heptose:LPS heptosyltransferase